MTRPWIGIALVLAILAISLGCLARLTPKLSPEVVRKALHIGMGAVTLTFPWLFEEAWPVLVLAGLATLMFVALRTCPTLRRGAGQTLHCIARDSHGEIHFALGTALTFALSSGYSLIFFIPMLILTLADAAAALVGLRFGRHSFAIGCTPKSIEGSIAFFLVALPCVCLPLSVVASPPGPVCLAVSILVAAVATGFEAISGRGWDNLTVPLGAFAALAASSSLGDQAIAPVHGGIRTSVLLAVAPLALALAWTASSRLRADCAARWFTGAHRLGSSDRG